MLISLVLVYIMVSLAVSLWAAQRVHSSRDFYTTGRQLPLLMVTAMMFAGWFGAETVMGIPATFMEEGIIGLMSDPLGAAACLILFGVFFARRLYRLNLMTIGDFYHQRYDRGIEVITGIAIALSYLGWVAAQITALGMVLHVLTDHLISINEGIIIGTIVVVIYTIVGGLWSVAVTVSIQIVITVIALSIIALMIGNETGGVMPVWEHALANDAFKFPENPSPLLALAMLTSFLTLAFGSIPQQDVFQRANAARTEQIAMWSAIFGGLLYLVFSFLPLFIAYSAHLIDPSLIPRIMAENGEQLIPELIKTHFPLSAQILFYGALTGVIMGTSASTLLAPSLMLSENIFKGLFRNPLTDEQLLLLTRVVIFCFALLVAIYALWARELNTGLHAMVEAAYKVTLVVAFVPLVAGLFFEKATTQGAWWSVIFGLFVWIAAELTMPDAEVGAQWWGLLASITGMILGSWYRPETVLLNEERSS
jgi:Na+/proline symporter